ncbi:TPA: hypothetical protein N0F65_002161 [Lagenidium giganteum]|uniref:Transposase Tc1-like domain-containing protein n=1 Tax=Lagenidium giganteum TaxID=4803 RepID=A0AAV2YQ44_9STRA|nr:TPA: hypothetical protein N0F65_002161 [Lagenidium giganteum]
MREQLHKNGKGYKAIAKQILLPASTARNIVKKFQKHSFVSTSLRLGRPPAVDARVQQIVVREVMQDRKTSSAKLSQMLRGHHQIVVSTEAVRQILHRAGLNGRAARKKPFISRVNKKKRLTYAMELKDWTLSQWKNVLFTGESKFNVGTSDGHVYVWRRVGEELNSQCLVPTFKTGVKGIMVWVVLRTIESAFCIPVKRMSPPTTTSSRWKQLVSDDGH